MSSKFSCLNKTFTHEYENDAYYNLVQNQNLLTLQRSSIVKFKYNSAGKISGVITESGVAPTGALSAKIASLLDSKIDDGRPGRGRVLASKNGFARTATTTQQRYKAACYEGSSDNVHNSIYQASTD